MRAQIGLLLAACLAVGACSTGGTLSDTSSVPVKTSAAEAMSRSAALAQPDAAPQCITEGCCTGHGDVAYIQPDRFIMCTDGEPSRICDCH